MFNPNESTSSTSRSRTIAKSGVSRGQGNARLRKVQTDARKDKRNLLTKRRRGMADEVELESFASFPEGALETAMNNLRLPNDNSSNNDNNRNDGLLFLRRVLCCNDPPIQHIVSTGCVDSLIQILRNSTEESVKSNTIWCLTNIATGDHVQTGSVVKAVPELLQIITGASDELREQACWTIGNIAGDSDKYRSVLIANGSVRPLLDFLTAATTTTITTTTTPNSMAQTAAWTLSNLARGTTPAGAFIETGSINLLLSLLTIGDKNISVEVWWIFSFLTAKDIGSVDILIQQGLIQILEQTIANLNSNDITSIPVIRVLGNLTSGPQHWLDVLLTSEIILLSISRICSTIDSGEKSVLKETMWSLANILGGSELHRNAGLNAGFLQHALNFLHTDKFDLQKEGVFALRNAIQNQQCLISLISLNALHEILIKLMKVHDGDMALACIQILKAIAFANQNTKSSIIQAYLNCGMYEVLENMLYIGCGDHLGMVVRAAIDELFENEDDDDDDAGGGDGMVADGLQHAFNF
jgi:importin subunit alpha-6/7